MPVSVSAFFIRESFLSDFMMDNKSVLFLAVILSISIAFPNLSVRIVILTSLLLLGTLHLVYSTSSKPVLRITPVTLVILLFWIWCAVSFFLGDIFHANVIGFYLFCTLPIAYWLSCLIFDDKKTWNYLVKINTVLMVLLIIHGLVQMNTGKQFTSLFAQPNTFGAYLNLSLFLFLPFYLTRYKETNIALHVWLFSPVILIVMGIFLTGGKGAILSLLIATGILIVTLTRKVPMKRLAGLLIVITVSFILANTISHGKVIDRFENTTIVISENDPDASVGARMVIWGKTLQLIGESPWYGHGPLSFPVKYAAYSPASDQSSRLYVHNDYLQIWFELGLPGLILMIILGGMLLYCYFILLKSQSTDNDKIIEVTAIFCGLVTIALHSLVTFNFYIHPILILFGLALGRLNTLIINERIPVYGLPINWSIVSVRATLVGVSLIVTIFSMSWLAMYYHEQQGKKALLAGDLAKAERYLDISTRIISTEINQYTRAVVYLDALGQLRTKKTSPDRKKLYQWTEEALSKAETLNPYSSNAQYGLGVLYMMNPDLKGDDWLRASKMAFEMALVRDPRHYQARLSYAILLDGVYEQHKALELMKDGLKFRLPFKDFVEPYEHILEKSSG